MVRWIGVVLCLAVGTEAAPPAEPRTPIAPPEDDAPAGADAVVERIHSWLVGTALRHKAIDFVPLHARTPGEARRRGAPLPSWSAPDVVTTAPALGTVMLRPPGRRPLLVVPGRLWTIDGIERCSVESALVAGRTPSFIRVARAAPPICAGHAFAIAGWTGARLADPSAAWAPRPPRAAEIEASALFRGCERLTRVFENSADGTLVGCVALVGGEPVVTYAFGDAPVFGEARRDFVALAVAAALELEASGQPEALLRQRASRARPRAQSVALLRSLCRGARRFREVPGGGARWHAGTKAEGHVARALLDGEGRLVFFGSWRVAPAQATAQPSTPAPAPGDADEDLRRTRARRERMHGGQAPRLPPLLPGG